MMIVLLTGLVGLICLLQSRTFVSNDGLVAVNRRFRYEPAIFARFRWIANAQTILHAADEKVGLVYS
jgi:hypothetical protein